jgi:hypothetical protein
MGETIRKREEREKKEEGRKKNFLKERADSTSESTLLSYQFALHLKRFWMH